MGYRITKFGSVDLPSRHEAQDATTGEIQSSMVRLPGGGGYDAGGTVNALRPGGYPLRVSGRMTAATAAALKTSMYTLRALRGEYNQLYRTPDGGSANSEYVWARCLSVYSDRDWAQRLHEDVTLDFAVESSYWSGSLIDTQGSTSAGTQDIAFDNTGNVSATEITVSLTPAGGALTYVSISQVDMPTGKAQRIEYSGTVPSGGTLIFDCAARSVTNNGTDDYTANFTFHSAHEIGDWLAFESGGGTLRIRRTGGTLLNYQFYFRESFA